MTRENAAERHIREIRISKGLDTNSVPRSVIRDLEAATKVLSEQLYQKSTRFLMELIQNADDNTYGRDKTPTLHLTYAERHLRVDCNETGFTAKNVEAICSIGCSSKAEASVSREYVGEKGIGFKAVFKVSDVVWISSGDYSFKFDKRQPMGMIAPIPDRLPGEKRTGWTTFYLQLSPGYNVQELIDELKSLDSRLLMFLRRLRRIEVTVVQSRDSVWTTSIKRSEEKFDGLEGLKLSQDLNSISYVMMRHKIRGLHGEVKRSGISESEVLLAFPLDDKRQPVPIQQQVFAFLPIRDYGFKFLIHADFLLIASREDIDRSSHWNVQICEQLVDAFLECVRSFNKTRNFMRYLWPRFLPHSPFNFNFFITLKKGILKRLSEEAVLKCWSGNWAVPTSLIFVPERFRDNSGKPFTMTSKTENAYLSPKYADGDFEHLKQIGVVEMDAKKFILELKRFIGSDQAYFEKQSKDWHSHLATVLTALPADLESELKDLPLIQLRTGQWICAKGNNILFPGQAEGWELPGGMDLLVAHPNTMKDNARHHLCRKLGVRQFNVAQVTDLIVKQHADEQFEAAFVSRKDLISQLYFLYRTGWRSRGYDRFWFATEDDRRSLGQHLYIDRPEISNSATKFFANSRTVHKFIHPDYLTANKGDPQGWCDWLQTNMRVSFLPHLVRVTRWDPVENTMDFEMNPDFEFILRKWPCLDVLYLICDHWDVYGCWLSQYAAAGKTAEETKAYGRLVTRLSTMKVETADHNTCSLKDTVLPLADIVSKHTGQVSFLNVPQPDHPRWLHLRHLGVGVKDDVMFYLRSLEALKNTKCNVNVIAALLEQIQARYMDDQAAVRKYFCEEKSTKLYIPLNPADKSETAEYGWVGMSQCLWSGPPCLRRHFCLSNVYPSCHRLLTEIAGVNDMSMRELVLEVLSFEKTDPTEYIRAIFAELDKFLEKDQTYTMHVTPLQERKVWPISMTTDLEKIDRMMSAASDMSWFIADTELHKESFAGIIPLLSFPNDGIQRIERILNSLDLDHKRLSRAATSTPKVIGRHQFSQTHTQSLRAKSEFLTRLVPRSSADKKETQRILHQLQNVEVYTADRVVQKYNIKVAGESVQSREIPGNVVLTPGVDGAGLKIYLRDGYLETERNPDELVRSLATFSGIDRRPNGMYLLLFTIIEPVLSRIATAFRKGNIPVDYPEDLEGEQEWLNSARRMLHKRHLPTFQEGSTFHIISSNGGRGELPDTDGDPFGGGESTTDGKSNEVARGQRLSNGMTIVIPSRLSSSRSSLRGGGTIDPELAFKGEQFFSNFLANTLKEIYKPDKHWTSPLRSRDAKMTPYQASGKTTSAFTIVDTDGAWTALASRSGVGNASDWISQPPTWHFDVKTTRGPLAERFVLTTEEFEHARQLSLQAQVEARGIPTEVLMLIRVFHVDSTPDMRLYIDPWGLLSDGDLRLKAPGNYMASIQ